VSIPDRELVCPMTTRAEYRDMHHAMLPVDPPRCACGWTGIVAELVASGRTRARQFPPGRYPEPMPWRGALRSAEEGSTDG
jgi:hypothetical protein